MLQIIH